MLGIGDHGPQPAGPWLACRHRQLHGRSGRPPGGASGRALGAHLIEWAAAAGFEAIQFNAVVETNGPAVRLWLSLGFRIVGTVPRAFDSRRHGLVGLHVMWRPLSPGSGERRRAL